MKKEAAQRPPFPMIGCIPPSICGSAIGAVHLNISLAGIIPLGEGFVRIQRRIKHAIGIVGETYRVFLGCIGIDCPVTFVTHDGRILQFDHGRVLISVGRVVAHGDTRYGHLVAGTSGNFPAPAIHGPVRAFDRINQSLLHADVAVFDKRLAAAHHDTLPPALDGTTVQDDIGRHIDNDRSLGRQFGIRQCYFYRCGRFFGSVCIGADAVQFGNDFAVIHDQFAAIADEYGSFDIDFIQRQFGCRNYGIVFQLALVQADTDIGLVSSGVGAMEFNCTVGDGYVTFCHIQYGLSVQVHLFVGHDCRL